MRKKPFILMILLAACPILRASRQDSIVGVASYYANSMHGRKTASGETYDKNNYTCAHMKFGFGTKLRVKHLDTGKEVIVKVTDRGPYSKKFTIDLSYAAAKELGIIKAGHAKVAIFPYDENREHQKQEAKIPSFMEFRISTRQLPHYAFKDTMKVTPILLPITGSMEK